MAPPAEPRLDEPDSSRTFLYFAYGSNLSSRRLRAPDRAPSAVRVAIAQAPGYRLGFDKIGSVDGSGKCDCEWTGRDVGTVVDRVWGVVWRIAETERGSLDRIEGKGAGYRVATITVLTDAGPVAAMTYIATAKDPLLKPYRWYRHHVLVGAIEARLPAAWIETIRAVEVIDDPDPARAAIEMARHASPDVD